MVWPSSVEAEVMDTAKKKRIARKAQRMIFMRDTLPHRADFFRCNLIEDADFAGLAERIDRVAQIFLRELVDVIVSAVFGDFHDAATNFKIAVRIRGILQRNGNARI